MRRVRSQFPWPVLRLPLVALRGGAAVAIVAILVLVLPGGAAAQSCPNADVRAQQGSMALGLPDCMALEQASPATKFSQGAAVPKVSSDGERVSYTSRGALNDPPALFNLLGDHFVAARGEEGWTTGPALQGAPTVEELTSFANVGFSPDFSRWLGFGATQDQRVDGVARAFRVSPGAVEPLSPLLTPAIGPRLDASSTGLFSQGASADHSRWLFAPQALATTYLPDDPSPSADADRNVYAVQLDGDGEPSLELLARDATGTVWGGRCGTRVGGVIGGSTAASNSRAQGAVSLDGSRVYFSTRPSQPDASACDTASNRLRMLTRTETVTGPEIAPLIAAATGDCDRAVEDPNGACSTADGDDLYQGASVDGSRIYFTTTRQLADSDLDVGGAQACTGLSAVAGCDLYLYDAARPAGERLIQVSAGEPGSPTPGDGAGVFDGIAAVSGDGSHAYFVAEGVLTNDANTAGATPTAGQPNFYSYSYSSDDTGSLTFIGTLATSDAAVGSTGGLWNAKGTFRDRAYPVPATGDSEGLDAEGGAGHLLFFEAAAALTTDDTDGTRRDVFRYDATSQELTRISKGAPGGADGGPFDATTRPLIVAGGGIPAGTAFAEIDRWVNEDGSTVLLRTDEGLAADDDNGIVDTYLWRDGELYRLPGTSVAPSLSPTGEGAAAMSHDGNTIAFGSYSPLLPGDGDSVSDIYVARVGGGFEIDPDESCDALTDSCHGLGEDPLGSPDAGTRASDGAGNAVAGERKRIGLAGMSSTALRRVARSGVLVLRVRTTAPGTISATAKARIGKRARRVATKTVDVRAAGRVVVKLRLGRAVRQRLKGGKAVPLSIQIASPGARSRTRNVRLPGASS